MYYRKHWLHTSYLPTRYHILSFISFILLPACVDRWSSQCGWWWIIVCSNTIVPLRCTLCVCTGDLLWACSIAQFIDSDDDGATALHLASYFGQSWWSSYLVRSCGFDLKAIDKVCLHCLLLVWCVLCPLWTHLLHGHSRHRHLYLSCVNPLIVCISNVTSVWPLPCLVTPDWQQWQ